LLEFFCLVISAEEARPQIPGWVVDDDLCLAHMASSGRSVSETATTYAESQPWFNRVHQGRTIHFPELLDDLIVDSNHGRVVEAHFDAMRAAVAIQHVGISEW